MADRDTRYYAFKLFPPRPSFPADITGEEAEIMAEHVAYWTELLNAGTAVAFGAVADPTEPWGLAIVEAGPDTDINALREHDPVIRRGLGSGPGLGAAAPDRDDLDVDSGHHRGRAQLHCARTCPDPRGGRAPWLGRAVRATTQRGLRIARWLRLRRVCHGMGAHPHASGRRRRSGHTGMITAQRRTSHG